MSRYTNDNDKNGVSSCYAICAEKWMPAVLEADTVLGENYTLIKHEDGTMQAAFRGQPLYLSSEDWDGTVMGLMVCGIWRGLDGQCVCLARRGCNPN